MEPDLTKLVSITTKNAFKNNNVYNGSVTVTGTTSAGLNELSFTVPLNAVPDLVSALFNGPTDTIFSSDPRPGNAWFKKGFCWVLGNDIPNGYIDYPVPFRVTMTISGANAIIKLSTVQQFTASLVLTSTTLYYRIIDYSVF